MRLANNAHLTYCSNIHPGETWDEIYANLKRYLPAIKRQVIPDQPMGVGLRLSAAAVDGLLSADQLQDFRDWLHRQDLYVFTLNGFPYGAFHGSRIKDAVYRPDWREPARLDYSNRLAEVLAALLQEGMDGSISSVPGAYQAHLTDAGDMARMVAQLVQHAVHLHRLHETTGRVISMALEPEPGCLLETSDDAVAFFTGHLFAKAATQQTMALTGLDEAAAQALLHRHLALCLDACHAAVAFEEPAACLAKLRQANIPIHKVQLSTGLSVAPPGPEQRAALAPFAEDVYLHQVVARSLQGLKRYADLPDALADDSTADEWRIHYHVPIWAERMGAFATTRPWLEALLDLHRQSPICAHWEVETYTWSVLPESLRPGSVDAAIAQELQWARERLI